MDSDHCIVGARRFLGAGVYTSVPATLPAALRDRAVIVGCGPELSGATKTLLRLAEWCRSVTVVGPNSIRPAALQGRSNVAVLGGTEIVCVDGIEQLECVVVRHMRTGTISAHAAAALFLLSPPQGTAGLFKNSSQYVQSARGSSPHLEHIAESTAEKRKERS